MDILGKYGQPTRNIRCMYNDNLETCTKKAGFDNWKFVDVIGKGSFGVVSKYIVDYHGNSISVAVKKTSLHDRNTVSQSYDEVEYSYYMSETGLGPKVYYTFFDREKQYFIMETMDMSCSKFFSDSQYNNLDKIIVLEKMMNILKKQIFIYDLLCADVKAGNFVVNINNLDVKIIDFGPDFCYFENNNVLDYVDPVNKKNIFYFTQLIQIKYIMHHENDIQLDSDIFKPIDLEIEKLFVYITSKELLEVLLNDKNLQWSRYIGDIYSLFDVVQDLYRIDRKSKVPINKPSDASVEYPQNRFWEEVEDEEILFGNDIHF